MTVYSDDEYQRVYQWFAKKQTDTRARGLTTKLSRQLGISLAFTNRILCDLLREGLLSSNSGSPDEGTLTCHIPSPTPASEKKWAQVLGNDSQCQKLLPCHSKLADWESTDLQRLLDGLLVLRASLPRAYQLTTYEASSRYLLSSAKLLDSLDKRSLQQFGIDTDMFRKAISYVVIAGPAQAEQVLLIENPQSFEFCIHLGLHQKMALVSTYGYGLQWAQFLENQESVLAIIRAGEPEQNLQKLLSNPLIFFWGDLDYEGINIFQSIKSKLPHCLLSNLYLPMIERLLSGKGHPYCRETGKEKQRNKSDLKGLEKAIDQESLSSSSIQKHCNGGLSLDILVKKLAQPCSNSL